ncbi:MAG: hypothetical protein IT378_10775 [Sandaracinaceae bacterium]|nr:hypothetical protein [Sandaracinaceae bacterium]
MKHQTQAATTWKLASYLPPERRKATTDRRKDEARSAQGERREGEKRTLKSLLRF